MAYKAITLIILLLALVFRFADLNKLPVFADESIYVRWAQVMKAETSLRFLPLSDGKQPLYMWSIIPVFKIVSDPVVAGRLVSAILGVLGIAGVGLFTHLLFNNRRQTIIATLLYSVLPYAVFFSRMALADTMLSVFIIWGLCLFLYALQKSRWDFAMLAGFAWGFAWLTKTPAMVGLLLLPSLLLLTPWKIKNLGFLFTVWTIAFGMYNILRLGPEFHMIALRNQDYIYPLAEVLKHPLDPLIPHLKDSINYLWYLATPVGLLLAIWGLIAGKLTHWKPRLILAVWWLVPVFGQAFIARGFTARYLLYTVPIVTILISHAIENIGQHTQKHVLVWLSAALIIIPSMVSNYFGLSNPEKMPLPVNERSGYLEEWTAGQGIKEVAQQIIQMSKQGPVMVGSEGYFGTPFSALELYLNKIPNVRITGVGVAINSVPESLTNSLEDNRVVLVVNSSRFGIKDPEKSGLKLLGSYPKAIRVSGTREYLLFFELKKI